MNHATAVQTLAETGGRVEELPVAASLNEASALLPAGSYTTLRTYGGRRLLRLAQHVIRLSLSLKVPVALDEERARRLLRAALDRFTGGPEARLRLTFAPPRLFVSIEPFTPFPDALYAEGVRCATVGVHREHPLAKSTSFIAAAGSAVASLPAGIHEGLMVSDGRIREGLSSNFFASASGVLWTDEGHVLPGVTRAIVLELAEGVAEVRREAPALADVGSFAEAFLTSVSREVLPVVEIDGRAIGGGRPGPISRALRQRFVDVVSREAEEP